jgi:DNA-binding transcriptional regulator YiaG
MPNIATVLKAEVTRLARKELRAETEALKRAITAQRSEVAALKRRVQDLEAALKRATKQAASIKHSAAAASSSEATAGELRFRASGMAANRKRLGLSAADFGLLVGATGQSVYAWETGKTKPRAQNLVAIAALRGIGKNDVLERLASLKGASS